MQYKITIVESEEGFAVWCEDLPGCVSQGSTKEEALENIQSAIREYLESIPLVEERFNTKVYRTEVFV
jgi:predicted RNase H-like HicB family nuclease